MSNYPSRVYINNVYRQTGESADYFSVSLPDQILNAKSMSINSASIPLLCYTFDYTESILYFQAGSNIVQSITLNLAKVYTTLALFMADLQAALIAQAGAGFVVALANPAANDNIMSISFPGGLNIIGFQNKETNYLGSGATYYNNCSDRLGFYNAPYTPIITPVATSVTASAPMTLLRTSCIYVGIDIINGDSFTSNSPSQAISNILFQLPVSNGSFGAIQSYFNNDYLLFSTQELPLAIYNVNVTLYDDNFNNLNLLPSAKVLIELSFKYTEDTPIRPPLSYTK